MVRQMVKLPTRQHLLLAWALVTYLSFVAMVWRLAHHTVFERFIPMLPWTLSWTIKRWRQWRNPKS